jgi:Mce-associated membrane protein
VTVPQPVDVAPAVAAAGHLVPDIIGYDTEKLDTDIARAHDGMTARFRAEYDKAMTAVRSAPQRRKVTAEVREIGVVSASPDRVRVLAFVNQSVDTPVQTGGDGLQTRLRLTLVRQDSRWLVDEMSAE